MFRNTTLILAVIGAIATATIRAQVPDDVQRKFAPASNNSAAAPRADVESNSDRLRQAQEIDSKLAAELPEANKDWDARKAKLIAVLRASTSQPTTQPVRLQPRSQVQAPVRPVRTDPRMVSADLATAIVGDLTAASAHLNAQIEEARGGAVMMEPAVQTRWQQLRTLLREISDIESAGNTNRPLVR